MRLLATRHGRTDWNDLGKIQGLADTDLNEEGINQARETAKKLENEHIDLIICSPLKRTRQTAELINEGRNIEIIYDERIIERDFGEFEGLRREEFDFLDCWSYYKNLKFEKAENIQKFYKRIYDFLDSIKEEYCDKTVLLVTHGGVSVALNAYFEGIHKIDEKPTKGSLKNCEVREYLL